MVKILGMSKNALCCNKTDRGRAIVTLDIVHSVDAMDLDILIPRLSVDLSGSLALTPS
jgi:hypothetical protein